MLNLRFDSADWVSGIRARDAESLARVEATSPALPRREEQLVRSAGSEQLANEDGEVTVAVEAGETEIEIVP